MIKLYSLCLKLFRLLVRNDFYHGTRGHAAGVEGDGSEDLRHHKGQADGAQVSRHQQDKNRNARQDTQHGETNGHRHADGQAGAHGLARP